MDAEETLFKKRLTELADKSYNNSQYLFTNFLSMAEQNTYFSMERELSYVPVTLFGGTADCERVMLRFGSEELCGYEEAFPIICIKIEPVIEKFGEQLSHRDYLGALMNLGVDRATLGDIIIVEKTAYLFCTEKMAPYLLENLNQVKHTHVKCTMTTDFPSSTITKLERNSVLVSSERADGILAKLYHLSRSQVLTLFQGQKVFVNGRIYENNSGTLKPGDRVSVRGYGKFIYLGKSHETRKGKLSVDADLYV